VRIDASVCHDVNLEVRTPPHGYGLEKKPGSCVIRVAAGSGLELVRALLLQTLDIGCVEAGDAPE
jgi:hypothetical protein